MLDCLCVSELCVFRGVCKVFTCLLSGLDFAPSYLDNSSSESLSSSSSSSSRCSSSSPPSACAECPPPDPDPAAAAAAAVFPPAEPQPCPSKLIRVGSYWVHSGHDRDPHIQSPSSSCLLVDFRRSRKHFRYDYSRREMITPAARRLCSRI